jgi:oligopeptide/dipeptide ABC transporter ATP-binding protein
MPETPLLALNDVSKTYVVSGAGLFSRPRQLQAVSDVSLSVAPGASVGLVGESGCGKSTLAKLAAGFVMPSAGDISVAGKPQRDRSGRIMAGRGQFQMVFQDPLAALDARMRIGEQIDEAIALATGRRADINRRTEILHQVGLGEQFADRYPHELSGGQRQRVVIGRALAAEPKLLICDEPLAALDVSVQAQILALLYELRRSLGLSLLFISHQLSTVRHLCDEVIVMYAGRIVERGPTRELFENPQHPYSRMLLSTALDPRRRQERSGGVVGEPPNPLALPSGCPFHTRCPLMRPDPCTTTRPDLRPVAHNLQAACHFA